MTLALAGSVTAVTAQAYPPGPARLVYAASQLDCTRWTESSRSDIETATGGQVDRARAARDGLWTLRARDTVGGVALEGWYDSLAVSRSSEAGELRPDTDGLLGGRYRGLLGSAGVYTASARPFVPDGVAEVADLATALDDLLPPLPPIHLAPDEAWRGPETRIRRLADTTGAGRPLARYAVDTRRQVRQVVPRGDTVPVAIRQTIVEQGEFTWDSAEGLTRRTRDIVVETAVPARGRIRQSVRSRIVQHIELSRLPTSACP